MRTRLTIFLLTIACACWGQKRGWPVYYDLDRKGYVAEVARTQRTLLSLPDCGFYSPSVVTSGNRGQNLIVSCIKTGVSVPFVGENHPSPEDNSEHNVIVNTYMGGFSAPQSSTIVTPLLSGACARTAFLPATQDNIAPKALRNMRRNNYVPLLYVCDSTLECYRSDDMGFSWNGCSRLAGYRISDLTCMRASRQGITTLYAGCDMPDLYPGISLLHGAIFTIESSEGGEIYGLPQLAVKHNTENLYNGYVARMPGKKGRRNLVMLTNDDSDYDCYASFFDGQERSWTYPQKINPLLRGENHRVYFMRRYAVVVYKERPEADGDPASEALMLWYGKSKDLLDDDRNGLRFVIAESRCDSTGLGVLEPSVLFSPRGDMNVVVNGIWGEGESSSVRHISIRLQDVRRMYRRYLSVSGKFEKEAQSQLQ